jgi:AMMECR1 domain-containing protein
MGGFTIKPNRVRNAIRGPLSTIPVSGPLKMEELNYLLFYVDVLSKPEQVVEISDLNQVEYGITQSGKSKAFFSPPCLK